MKTTKLFLPGLIFLFLVVAMGCSKDSPSIFLPNISASTWFNKADNTNTFFFLPAKENVESSTFDGNENLVGGGQHHFSGSFSGHSIEFTYDNNSGATKSGKKYSGTINDASNVITLSNPTLGALVLEKR